MPVGYQPAICGAIMQECRWKRVNRVKRVKIGAAALRFSTFPWQTESAFLVTEYVRFTRALVGSCRNTVCRFSQTGYGLLCTLSFNEMDPKKKLFSGGRKLPKLQKLGQVATVPCGRFLALSKASSQTTALRCKSWR